MKLLQITGQITCESRHLRFMPYLTRVADSILLDYLEVFGGVLVEGPRECGKTSTSLQHARSSVRLDESPQLQELVHLDPSAILRGESPRLIDEWQLAPTLWNVARHEIDNRQARGQFILSGSASPDDDTTRHSGAARFGRLRMRTMALAESHRSSAAISLAMLHQSTRCRLRAR